MAQPVVIGAVAKSGPLTAAGSVADILRVPSPEDKHLFSDLQTARCRHDSTGTDRSMIDEGGEGAEAPPCASCQRQQQRLGVLLRENQGDNTELAQLRLRSAFSRRCCIMHGG